MVLESQNAPLNSMWEIRSRLSQRGYLFQVEQLTADLTLIIKNDPPPPYGRYHVMYVKLHGCMSLILHSLHGRWDQDFDGRCIYFSWNSSLLTFPYAKKDPPMEDITSPLCISIGQYKTHRYNGKEMRSRLLHTVCRFQMKHCLF